MLLSVNIVAFRSCNECQLEGINDLLILIGRNGVGKTNILKAIEWAVRVGSTANSIESIGELHRPNSSVTLRVELSGQIFNYSVTLGMDAGQGGVITYLTEKLFIENETGSPIHIFSREKGELIVGDENLPLKVGALSPGAHSVLSLIPENSVCQLLQKFTNFLGGIRYYPLEEIEMDNTLDFVPHREYENWRNTLKNAKDANRTLVLKLLDLFLEKRERFEELQSLIGSDGLDIIRKILITPFDLPVSGSQGGESNAELKITKYYFVEFSPVNHPDGRGFPFSCLSYGTRRVVRLLTSLLFDGATVSLIEQPEDGIHAGLLHKLIPILRSYANPGQFLITSHSSEVLNRVSPNEVRLVDLGEGVTTVRALNAVELDNACRFMKNDGPLSDFLESVQEL